MTNKVCEDFLPEITADTAADDSDKTIEVPAGKQWELLNIFAADDMTVRVVHKTRNR